MTAYFNIQTRALLTVKGCVIGHYARTTGMQTQSTPDRRGGEVTLAKRFLSGFCTLENSLCALVCCDWVLDWMGMFGGRCSSWFTVLGSRPSLLAHPLFLEARRAVSFPFCKLRSPVRGFLSLKQTGSYPITPCPSGRLGQAWSTAQGCTELIPPSCSLTRYWLRSHS